MSPNSRALPIRCKFVFTGLCEVSFFVKTRDRGGIIIGEETATELFKRSTQLDISLLLLRHRATTFESNREKLNSSNFRINQPHFTMSSSSPVVFYLCPASSGPLFHLEILHIPFTLCAHCCFFSFFL